MNQSQLEQLRRMPLKEVVRKYLPLLNAKKITIEQYQWLLKQSKTVITPEPLVDILCREFGGRVIKTEKLLESEPETL